MVKQNTIPNFHSISISIISFLPEVNPPIAPPNALPNVPVIAETVTGFELNTWYGLFGPGGLPRPIVDKLNKVLNEVLAEDTIKERLTKAGVVVKGSTPDEWRQFMIAEYKKWSSVREKAGIEQR